jgi:hypothetical protein
MAKHEADPRQRESERILGRISQEDGAGGRAAGPGRAEIAAGGTEGEDWAEYWGTRIGRTLGLVITVGLIGWLALYLVGIG